MLYGLCMLLTLISFTTSYAQVSLVSRDWKTISYPTIPLTNSGNDLTFIFPDVADGTMNYLYSKGYYDLTGKARLRADIEIRVLSGSPMFVYNTQNNMCNYTAHVRLFMWGRQDKWGEFSRWWSNPLAQELVPGVFTLSTTLNDPTQWSSVYGKFASDSQEASQGFERVKSESEVGLTFGGGCSFGHGVSTTGGEVEFILSFIGGE